PSTFFFLRLQRMKLLPPEFARGRRGWFPWIRSAHGHANRVRKSRRAKQALRYEHPVALRDACLDLLDGLTLHRFDFILGEHLARVNLRCARCSPRMKSKRCRVSPSRRS